MFMVSSNIMKLILSILICSIILSINGALGGNIRTEAQISEQFYRYLSKTQNTEDKIEFQKMIEIFSYPQYVYRNSFDTFTKPRQDLTCIVCRAVIDTVQRLLEEGQGDDYLLPVFAEICALMQIQPGDVCDGVIKLNLPIILYVIRNKENFNTNTFCGIAFQSNDQSTCPFEDEEFDWTIELPAKNVTYQPRPKADETFKIVQVSDLHYDPVYEPYGLADCNEPTCCRLGQTEQASPRWNPVYNDESAAKFIGRTEKGSYLVDLDLANEVQSLKWKAQFDRNRTVRAIPENKQAGYWGDYRHCDTPWWAVEDAIDKIVENHQNEFDYVYYTGDTTDHGVWETTNELITESQRVSVEKFKSAFGDVPVFPILGNHESQPVNQYAPTFITDSFSSNWMYEMLADTWSVWLPTEATDTIKLGGYYSVLLRPGFRVVAINSNMCYRLNWWLHMQPRDINGQLQWLTDTLHKAELNNEKVHILSHIPAGRADCLQVYTREYKRIVERFADVISAEFNGHTHNDEFKVFYSKEDYTRPLMVAWNGGSVTANAHINPNYRIFDVDSSNYEIVDIDTWVYNLTEANLTPDQRPRWYKEYSFKERYGLESLSVENLDNLLTRMVTTEKGLFNDFHRLRSKSYDTNTCSENCVRDYLRVLTTTELFDNRKSESLWETYSNNRN